MKPALPRKEEDSGLGLVAVGSGLGRYKSGFETYEEDSGLGREKVLGLLPFDFG